MTSRSRRPTDEEEEVKTDVKTDVFDRPRGMRAISMKTPAAAPAKAARPMPEVKIRSIAEVAKPLPPGDPGNLAPPRDPQDERSRRRVDLVVWGCVAVILACGVMLAIWFLAR